MIKADKVNLVKDLTDELKGAKSLFLVNYAGLNVKAQQDLKSKLKETGAKMVVVKNTLLKRAIESANLDSKLSDDSILSGQTAMVISSDDVVGPVQVLGKFAKENEVPKFKVGVIEGMFQDEEGLKKLSTLPGRDALLGQVLGSLISNLYGLVGTLNSPMSQLVYILDQKSKS